jgi:hypothetical protein
LDYQNARNAITQEEKKFEDLKKRILSLQEEIAALGQ